MANKQSNAEAIVAHLKAWIEAGVTWSKAELMELESVYRAKAPAWAKKRGKKEPI